MKRKLLCTMIALVGLIGILTKEPAWAQNRWVKYNNNPVLDIGSPNAWDGGRIFYHFILFDGAKYRMWYTGYNPTLNAPPAIGYAISSDGLSWTKYANNPILKPIPGGFEDEGVYEPVVIYDGIRFRMWYDGTSQSQSSFATGYATSSDGINWTRYVANPVLKGGPAGSWDAQGGFPSTVHFDGTGFKMWYTGSDGRTLRFGYATSTDGINWSKYANNPILDIGPPGAWDTNYIFLPDVMFDGSNYQMWYEGFAGIGHANSSDGIHWIKDPANPVLEGGAPGTWESQGVGQPRVLVDGKKYRMWYIGADDPFNFRIGYATSADPTAVTDRESATQITTYALLNNYPNPFNPETSIEYQLPYLSDVKLNVYNLKGEFIRTLVDAQQPAGRFRIKWDGKDQLGGSAASGVYLYKLQAGKFSETKKMILLR